MEHKSSFSLMAFLIVISLITFASAATTINNPAASSTFGCTGVINVTSTDVDDYENPINVTIYAKSTLTANTTYKQIAVNNSVNFTVTGNMSVGSFNLYGIIEDANDYIFNATLTNRSGAITGADTNTVIVVDCTVPQTPTISSPAESSSITSSGVQTFNYDVVGRKVTTCTYKLSRGGATTGDDYISGSGTHSGATCTFTKDYANTNDNGLWYHSVTASDETNTSTSSTSTVSVELVPGNGGLTSKQSKLLTNGSDYTGWIILIVLAIILVIIFRKK